MTCAGSASPFQRIRNFSASVAPWSTSLCGTIVLAEAARRLGGVGQHHHRDPAQVEAGLLVGDVVGLAHARASARASPPRPARRRGRRRCGWRCCRARRVAARGRRSRRPAGPRPSRTGSARRSPRCPRRGSAARSLPCPARRSASRTRRRPRARDVPQVMLAWHSARSARHPDTAVAARSARRSPGATRLAVLSTGLTPRRLAALRREYGDAGLDAPDLAAGSGARCSSAGSATPSTRRLHEPNAMVVTHASGDGRPSSRMVLLKAVDERGFVFYTNYESRKGQPSSTANPRAALLFPWHDLQRQVRVEGAVERVSQRGERGVLRLAVRGAPSSAPGPRRSRARWPPARSSTPLLRRGGGPVRRPATCRCPRSWGGFRVVPETVEFWQGRKGRCTTGWSTAGQGSGGRSCGWRPEAVDERVSSQTVLAVVVPPDQPVHRHPSRDRIAGRG